MRWIGCYLVSLVGFGALTAWSGALPRPDDKQTPDAKAVEFFEAKVRPLLVKNCFGCHNDKMQMGGVRLDSLAGMLKGNSGGSVVVPGNPNKGLLLSVVHYDGKVKMPPAGKLTPDDIAVLTDWVKMGAPWTGVKVSEAAALAAKTGEYVITPEQRAFWSFRPVRKPPVPLINSPKNKAWVTSPIDAFVMAKLGAKGLTPAPRADRYTLIRRAYFDLIGLPPTAEEVDAFLADKSPDAFAKVVDRLLASPHYGERWARYWLDVARYADTKGYVFNEDRNYPNAYTYRDYVIRAFNDDLPYNQFIMEQLAADRLLAKTPSEDRRSLAALGFLTVGRRFLNNPHDIIDDRIDVTMRGFQGLTVNCARCHDHKFDPIPTKDYYALYGVFVNVNEAALPISPRAISDPYEAHQKKKAETEAEFGKLVMAQIALLRKNKETLPADIQKVLQSFRENTPPNDQQMAQLEPQFEPMARERYRVLKAAVMELNRVAVTKPELAMAMQDVGFSTNRKVFLRGNPNNLGAEVPRRFVSILSPGEPKPFTDGSGRLELAQAIASEQNPLTARVMVNRVWLRHFGAGLVRTPSDFGTRGEPPTHPELLDYLAARFMEEGWSLKKLHRLILLSSTYQMASEPPARAATLDPENRLLSHMNRRRLDLEATRDSLLKVAGRLDATVGGTSVELTTMPFTTRRTLYGFIDRQNLQGLYRTFDFASPDATSPQRFETTVPQQALFLMNSPFVVEQAKFLANRADVMAKEDGAERVRYLYRQVFGRTASAAEVAAGLQFLQSVQNRGVAQGESRLTTVQDKPKPDKASGAKPAPTALTPWEAYVQVLLMTNEFAFVD